MAIIFKQSDIDRMKVSEVTQEFVQYFNRLSEERKKMFAENRPDLFSAILTWQREDLKSEHEEVTPSKKTMDGSSKEEASETRRMLPESILRNAYENIDIPTFIKDDFRPVEALTINDSANRCPAHHILLKKYNQKFHSPKGSVLGMNFYHCSDCNRLYIKQSRYEENCKNLTEWKVPFNFYDYETSRQYLLTQLKPYELAENEAIYVADQWIEEDPVCPVHKQPLEDLPCVCRYKDRHVDFNAYYCEKCQKVLLRRTSALDLEDRLGTVGIPARFERIEEKTPNKTKTHIRKTRPDYLMDEGVRKTFDYGGDIDFYILDENDTVMVSDSIYCSLDGHDTESVLGLILVAERSKKRHSYLFMLGYCSECQKYFMDEVDYKTVSDLGRLETNVLLDITDDSTYKITSGEEFNQERNHLNRLENKIAAEEQSIFSKPDYVNPYTTLSGYDDGGLFYNKAISKRKYEGRLEALQGYKDRPYEYRVDIVKDGKSEAIYIGNSDISLNNKEQVISFNSDFGRKLVNYKTIKIKKNGQEYNIKLSRQFDIHNAYLYGYHDNMRDDDIIFRSGVTDPFLRRVLNIRKKQHYLIDIFVTIQENQNSIVDAPFEKNLIVQGCAGSGKTMVLLHRLSSLKYNKPNFDFGRDALILTPNDNFTLHIKDVAESLQIGSITRSSVEKYYQDTLALFSDNIKPAGRILSEMSVRQELVDYIYSNEFRNAFADSYQKVISERNRILERLRILISQMEEHDSINAIPAEKNASKPLNVQINPGIDDSKVIPQASIIADRLSEKITARTRVINSAEEKLNELIERKKRLSRELPNRRISILQNIQEAAGRAKIKALAVCKEDEQSIKNRRKRLEQLESDRKRIEKLMGNVGLFGNALSFNEYLGQNSDWIYDAVYSGEISKWQTISAECAEKKTLMESLRPFLTVSQEEILSQKSSDDLEVATVLDKISKAKAREKELQEDKERVEKGWFPLGRSRRLSDIASQIQQLEASLDVYKGEMLNVINHKRSQYENLSKEIDSLTHELEVKREEIINSIEKSKKTRLSTLKGQITRQKMSITEESMALNNRLKIINQLNEHMTEKEIAEWLTQIAPLSLSIEEDRRVVANMQRELERREKENAEIDGDIETATKDYQNLLAKQYPEEIRLELENIHQETIRYSDAGTYRMIMESAVKPFMEANGIISLPTANRRYELYARLLFAMRFYNKRANNVKFCCIDEGQDLAPNEYQLLSDLNPQGVVFNIFGDINQLIKPNRGIANWNGLINQLNASQYVLNENYRNTNQITRFCNNSFNLSMAQTGVDGAKVREITRKELEDELNSLHVGAERIAILLPRIIRKKQYLGGLNLFETAKNVIEDTIVSEKVAIMYVDEVKGIEFDKVFVITNNMRRNEKYIAFTRALSELILVVDDNIDTANNHSQDSEEDE